MAEKVDHKSRKDNIYKLNVMGFAGCGKTAFCTRLCNSSFPKIHTHTKKRDSYVTSIEVRHVLKRKITAKEFEKCQVTIGDDTYANDFLRTAKIKDKNVPLWDDKSWGNNGGDGYGKFEDGKQRQYLRTLFGRDRKILTRYYVELADIPGTLNESLDLEEKNYTESLWNHANCIYPLVTKRDERYDPPTADDLAEMKKLEHDSVQREQQYGVTDDADREALLPKDTSLLPEAQKQDATDNLNHLLRYARITMGFIIIFDVTKRASWEKAKWIIASIQENIFRGNSARPPIVLFGNKLDVLKRGEPGLIKRAFMGVKAKMNCESWAASNFPPLTFFVGSVKDDYAVEIDLTKKEDKIPNLKKILAMKRFTLEEVVNAAVTMRFDANWMSGEESSLTKSGLVFQVYKHCENMNGMLGDEDDSKIKGVKKESRLGCCASVLKNLNGACSKVFCAPCDLGKMIVGMCCVSDKKTGDDAV